MKEKKEQLMYKDFNRTKYLTVDAHKTMGTVGLIVIMLLYA